jgi:DeoR family transcriptional regulator of aga operon
MIRVSRVVIAIADASKFGRRSLSVIAPIRRLHQIITDCSAAPEMIETLRELGVDVIVV